MKFKLFIVLISLYCSHIFAVSKDSPEETSLKLYREQLFISSALFAKKHVINQSTISQQYSYFLEDLASQSGTEIFYDLSTQDLLKIHSPTFQLIAGKKLIETGNAAIAFKTLAKIPLAHKYRAEALLYTGVGMLLSQKIHEADKYFFECAIVADDLARKEKNMLSKRYYKIIEDRCVINRARSQYQLGRFENALIHYQQIDKRSFLWPYTLSEMAWSHLKLGNSNRALGLAVTYKSPLLESYFTPESELIMALAYRENCLWKDADIVIQNFYNKVKPQSDRILQMITKLDASNSLFDEIRRGETHVKDSFIRSIATQISKKVKYNFAIILHEKIIKEIEKTTKPEYQHLNKALEDLKKNNIFHINKMIKESLVTYLNKINKTSLELFNVSIEILADQRDIEYTSKVNSVSNNRSRGSNNNISVKLTEYFYSFDGAFWADELGDYSFGLASQCQQGAMK
jgi:tetratricopeptide (TPR) repeat protein